MNRLRLSGLALVAAAATLAAADVARAGKLLVSEVLYNEVSTPFSGEWIEIYNGSDAAIDLSGYKIGDEETKLGTTITEGMFQFPAGATIAPGEFQVVASYASRFRELYDFAPTYEVGNYSPISTDPVWNDDAAVPNMSVYAAWDADGAKLNMANGNDQVLFLGPADEVVDQLSWADSTFFFNPSMPAQADGQSQYRVDLTVDTDTAADWALSNAAPVGAFWTSRSTPGTRTLPSVSTWVGDADGAWIIEPNWQDSRIPNGAGYTAIFGSAITAPRNILVTSGLTVGAIRFEGTNSYTLSGTDALTLNWAGSTATIDVVAGSHAINAPLTLLRPTLLNVAAGSNLALNGTITTSSTFAMSGAGTATLAKGLRGATLRVDGGTLAIAAGGGTDGTTRVTALAIAAGGRLDLNEHALVVDYAADVATNPLAAVALLAKDGRLTSSVALADPRKTVGVVDTARLANRTSFGGIDVDASALLAAVTFLGDANLDFAVNFEDLLSLARNYNSTTATWVNGDSNYDGAVDFTDLLALARNYNQGAPATAAGLATVDASALGAGFAADWALAQALVPEPTTLAALGMGLGLAARRRRA